VEEDGGHAWGHGGVGDMRMYCVKVVDDGIDGRGRGVNS
jgi:hypothetical protein